MLPVNGRLMELVKFEVIADLCLLVKREVAFVVGEIADSSLVGDSG